MKEENKLKATDLRIGNLVESYGNFKIIRSIRAKNMVVRDFVEFEFGEKQDIQDLKPIPLNEEWLKRFGFEPKEENSYFYRPEHLEITDSFISVLFDDGEVYIHVVQVDLQTGKNHIIELPPDKKYLHDLQNVCFYFLGTELTLK